MPAQDVAVTVTGRRLSVPETMRVHVQARADALARRYVGVHRVEAVLAQEGRSAVVECVAHVRRHPPVAGRGEAPDGWAAVDQAMQRVAEQLKRLKERRRSRRAAREHS